MPLYSLGKTGLTYCEDLTNRREALNALSTAFYLLSETLLIFNHYCIITMWVVCAMWGLRYFNHMNEATLLNGVDFNLI